MVPTSKEIVSPDPSILIYEVTGSVDGVQMFLGRMMPHPKRGGFNTTDEPGALPNGLSRWFWNKNEDAAIQWMLERKGL